MIMAHPQLRSMRSMASKFVFLQLSKSMDWLKSGLDWFKSVRESSLDSADDASDRRG